MIITDKSYFIVDWLWIQPCKGILLPEFGVGLTKFSDHGITYLL